MLSKVRPAGRKERQQEKGRDHKIKNSIFVIVGHNFKRDRSPIAYGSDAFAESTRPGSIDYKIWFFLRD